MAIALQPGYIAPVHWCIPTGYNDTDKARLLSTYAEQCTIWWEDKKY